MSKRAPGLPQRPRGFWPTPREAVVPLIPYLPRRARYGEPCAGDGQLIRNLADLWPAGSLTWASDIEPQGPGINALAVADIDASVADQVDIWVTNPPWPKIGQKGDPALSIIKHLAGIAPIWALLPWDFAANDYFGRVLDLCSDIVPIGRVSWMGNNTPGKDNCAWYHFSAWNRHPATVRARA